MKAAVLHAANQPLTIEEVSVHKPGPREVLLRTAFAGGLAVGDAGDCCSGLSGSSIGSDLSVRPPGARRMGVTAAARRRCRRRTLVRARSLSRLTWGGRAAFLRRHSP